MDSVDDPLRRAAWTFLLSQGGQFFVSPEGQFRMSFDTEASRLAEKLQAIVELDLDELQTIDPPRGYGRD